MPKQPRWHQVPGLVARRDGSVPLIEEHEQCTATDPEIGRCAGIRRHDNTPIASQHGNERGGWT